MGRVYSAGNLLDTVGVVSECPVHISILVEVDVEREKESCLKAFNPPSILSDCIYSLSADPISLRFASICLTVSSRL